MRLKLHNTIFLIALIFSAWSLTSQVAIGTQQIEDGIIFQMDSANKGLMIPQVALNSRSDVVTITPSSVEGLLVYNTGNAGSGNLKVGPGFYYWDSTEWVRIFNDGYTVQYEQTIPVRSANNSAVYALPGLDRTITAPYTGTYQIHVSGYYAAVGPSNACCEAAGYGTYMLEIDGTIVAQNFVRSASKKTPGNFLALAQQTEIIYNVDLQEGVDYNFVVKVRQWDQENMSIYSLDGLVAGNYGIWGVPTGPYNGNDYAAVDNAQDAYLTITLLRQF